MGISTVFKREDDLLKSFGPILNNVGGSEKINISYSIDNNDKFRLGTYLQLIDQYTERFEVTINGVSAKSVIPGYPDFVIPCILINSNTLQVLSGNIELPAYNEVTQPVKREIQRQENEDYVTYLKRYLTRVIISYIYRVVDSSQPNYNDNFGVFYDLVYDQSKGGLNLLSLLVLVSSLKFSGEINTFFSGQQDVLLGDYLLSRVLNSCDIAEGILQLCENVVLHASNSIGYGEGLLNLRYFDRDHDYVKANHPSFLEVIGDNEESTNSNKQDRIQNQFFLSVEIADNADVNMLDKYSKKTFTYFENFSLSTIFEPSKIESGLWNEFNKNDSSNAIIHYGLKFFGLLVGKLGGSFCVRVGGHKPEYYANKSEVIDHYELSKGTSYSIFLPVVQETIQSDISVNIDLNSNNLDMVDVKIIDSKNDLIKDFHELLKQPLLSIENKVTRIKELADKLSLADTSHESVIVLDLNHNRALVTELLCKSILRYINEKRFKPVRIAVINCEVYEMTQFVSFISLYYDKYGLCEWMDDKQIYFSTASPGEEFWIAGNNIQAISSNMMKLSLSKRIVKDCVNSIQAILNMREGFGIDPYKTNIYEGSQQGLFSNGLDEVKLFPFDLVVRNGENLLFENLVFELLNNDIQRAEFGCKIDHTHVRIGSKIHLSTFYEAEIIFHNNYFTRRFAYLLLSNMCNDIDFTSCNRKICFVGYETYTEMLLTDLIEISKKRFGLEDDQVSYIVYENARSGGNDYSNTRFRYLDKLSGETDFIFVVPINTTLSTFNKMSVMLMRMLPKYPIQLKSVYYQGIIQVRDIPKIGHNLSEREQSYWSEIVTDEKKIISPSLLSNFPGSKPEVVYQVLLSVLWQEPLKCSVCFPCEPLNELPLIETNKESIIPSQLIGLKDKPWSTTSKLEINDAPCRISRLRKFIYYGHIKRNTNHYEYYIRTATFFAHEMHSPTSKMLPWFESINLALKTRKDRKSNVERKAKEKNSGIKVKFDIVVSPMHFSNTAFVEAVNNHVFNGSSLVLQFDVDKEFRENVGTKFSDLRLLYEKLSYYKYNAEIAFHYVDDTIVTGRTFYRMKSIIKSIFPYENSNIKIELFKSVIVLVNRMSKMSILNYCENTEDYFSYLNLKISHLRNHKDACFLCNKSEAYKKLMSMTASIELYQHFRKKSREYDLLTLENKKIKDLKLRGEDYKEFNSKRERAYRRLFCNHILNEELSNLKEGSNDTVLVLDRFIAIAIGKKFYLEEYLMGLDSHTYKLMIEEVIKNTSNPDQVKNNLNINLLLSLLGNQLNNQELTPELVCKVGYALIYNEYDENIATLIKCIEKRINITNQELKEVVLTLNRIYEYELMMTFLYTITRPFTVYRKSYREVGFSLTLLCLELLLNDSKTIMMKVTKRKIIGESNKNLIDYYIETGAREESLSSLVRTVKSLLEINPHKMKLDLLKLLIKTSVELRSNYIIRHENILKIVNTTYEWGVIKESDETLTNDFLIYYLGLIKEVTSLSSDESKATFLEQSIIDGMAESKRIKNEIVRDVYVNFLRNVYIENTRVVYDSIKNFASIFREDNRIDLDTNNLYSFLNDYFYENYLIIMRKYKVDSEEVNALTKNYAKMYNYLKDRNKSEKERSVYDVKGDYTLFAKLISSLTGAEKVSFLVRRSNTIFSRDPITGVVSPMKRSFFSVFAANESKKVTVEFEDLALKCISKNQPCVSSIYGLTSEVYCHNSNCENMKGVNCAIIKFKNNSEDLHIRLEFKDNDLEYDRLYVDRLVRHLMLFANQISIKVRNDFTNNAIPIYLQELRRVEQLSKTRARYHSKMGKSDNYALSEKVHAFLQDNNQPEDDEMKYDSDIVNDSFKNLHNMYLSEMIGRTNTLLQGVEEDHGATGSDNPNEKTFQHCVNYMSIIKHSKYFDEICFRDGGGIPFDFLSGFPERIKFKLLRKRMDDDNNKSMAGYPDQLIVASIIMEIIESAAKNSIENSEQLVDITIDEEGEYLYISNLTKKTKKKLHKKIEDSLGRRAEGISLVTTVEYFFEHFGSVDPKIVIEIEDKGEDMCKFRIGLPIFEGGDK